MTVVFYKPRRLHFTRSIDTDVLILSPGDTHWFMVYGQVMLKSFRVLFRHVWYIDGRVSIPDLIRPICKIWCILENFAKKAPNLLQIGRFL